MEGAEREPAESPEGSSENVHGGQRELVEQLDRVLNVVRNRVGPGSRPFALAATAQVERDAPVAVRETLGDVVERVALLGQTVQHQNRRRLARAPVLPVEPHAIDAHPLVAVHGRLIWPGMR